MPRPKQRNTVTKEEFEDAKQWFKVHGFPDVDPASKGRGAQSNMHDLNGPTGQPTPEQQFCAAFLGQLHVDMHDPRPCRVPGHRNLHSMADCDYNNLDTDAVRWACDAVGINYDYFCKMVKQRKPLSRPGRQYKRESAMASN